MLKSFRRTAIGCGIMLLLVFGCIGAAFLGFDRICHTNLTQRLPIYPGAEIVSRRHNLATEFGIGNTVLELYTPDAPDDVTSWYARETGSYLRQAVQSGDWLYRVAQSDWSVTASERGTGSQILLFGTCVQ